MSDLPEENFDSSLLNDLDDLPALDAVEPYTPVKKQRKKKLLGTLQALASKGTCVDIESRTKQVISLFQEDQQLQSIIITRQGMPVGLIMRSKLNAKLGTRFGFDVYTKRSVALVMDSEPLMLDSNTPIETASQFAMRREKERLYDDMILVEDGFYHGVVSVQDL